MGIDDNKTCIITESKHSSLIFCWWSYKVTCALLHWITSFYSTERVLVRSVDAKYISRVRKMEVII